MAKEELLEMNGVVTEVLPDSRYLVTLENGHTLVAYSAGKMRKHHIRILAGDKVSLELDGHDARKPSFLVARPGESSGVCFAGLPLGHEFTSLVLALLQVGGHPPKASDDVLEQIRQLTHRLERLVMHRKSKLGGKSRRPKHTHRVFPIPLLRVTNEAQRPRLHISRDARAKPNDHMQRRDFLHRGVTL